jgi:hypothetical protein
VSWLLYDRKYADEAREWVEVNVAKSRGLTHRRTEEQQQTKKRRTAAKAAADEEPTRVTVESFRTYINGTLVKKILSEAGEAYFEKTKMKRRMEGHKVSWDTARRYLIKLGFNVIHSKGAVYIDGHDAPENKARRIQFSKYTIDKIWPHCKIWLKVLDEATSAEKLVSVHDLDAGQKGDEAFFFRPCSNCTKMPCAACQQREDDLLTVKAPPPAEFESEMFMLCCNDEATFFCNEALSMFWGHKHDEAMRQKVAGSGRMRGGNSSDLFPSGLIRVPPEKFAEFREYLLQRGVDAKAVDASRDEREYLDRHLDPYGPMNNDGDDIDWKDYQPNCAEQFNAAAVSIQEKRSIAEINAFNSQDKADLQAMCVSVGLSVRKLNAKSKEADKSLPELKKQLLAVVYPKGKEPPHVVFKFGVADAHLNIGKGKQVRLDNLGACIHVCHTNSLNCGVASHRDGGMLNCFGTSSGV